jgi:hypothetical protein
MECPAPRSQGAGQAFRQAVTESCTARCAADRPFRPASNDRPLACASVLSSELVWLSWPFASPRQLGTVARLSRTGPFARLSPTSTVSETVPAPGFSRVGVASPSARKAQATRARRAGVRTRGTCEGHRPPRAVFELNGACTDRKPPGSAHQVGYRQRESLPIEGL